MNETATIYTGDCADWLEENDAGSIHLSFLDPPFNQGKDYRKFDDKQDDSAYWRWMSGVLERVYRATVDGGWVYFMQREKNTEFVLRALREAGWSLKSVIVWKKKTSAVPCSKKFGLNYQIIAAATKGDSARMFNRLRISPPLPADYKFARDNGVYVTDVWDDIRELTAGYFSGEEAIRTDEGERFHKQQAPLALLARIILSSSRPNDVVFDPFAGTGTTLIAASLLNRVGLGVEIDPVNAECIRNRIDSPRAIDVSVVDKLYADYIHTEGLPEIWGGDLSLSELKPITDKEATPLTLFSTN